MKLARKLVNKLAEKPLALNMTDVNRKNQKKLKYQVEKSLTLANKVATMDLYVAMLVTDVALDMIIAVKIDAQMIAELTAFKIAQNNVHLRKMHPCRDVLTHRHLPTTKMT